MGKAIILAAGRGSRMTVHTDEKPKCLVELAGKPLLAWQIAALRDAGIQDIAVVCGYRSDRITALKEQFDLPFSVVMNSRWESTNMLFSLICALDWIAGDDCIISYSDIVYPAAHIKALMKDQSPLAVTYDALWEELWRLRQDGNPLADAETFIQESGRLKKIGATPHSPDEVQGQYMGLIKVTPEGWRIFTGKCREIGEGIAKTDMTGFLRLLLEDGATIGAVRVEGQWCEVDSSKDLALYENALTEKAWSHDWRNRE